MYIRMNGAVTTRRLPPNLSLKAILLSAQHYREDRVQKHVNSHTHARVIANFELWIFVHHTDTFTYYSRISSHSSFSQMISEPQNIEFCILCLCPPSYLHQHLLCCCTHLSDYHSPYSAQEWLICFRSRSKCSHVTWSWRLRGIFKNKNLILLTHCTQPVLLKCDFINSYVSKLFYHYALSAVPLTCKRYAYHMVATWKSK